MRSGIFAAVAVLAAAALVVVVVVTLPPVRLGEVHGRFKFKSGRLFAKVAQDKQEGLAIVDTGASKSVLSSRTFDPSYPVSTTSVETRFGKSIRTLYLFKNIDVMGVNLPEVEAMKKRGALSIVGLDVIAARKFFVISSKGVEFEPVNNSFNPECGPISLDFRGGDLDSGVSAIYLLFPVDGVERRFHLDSGRDTFVEATGHYQGARPTGLEMNDIVFNSLGSIQRETFFYLDADFGAGIGNVKKFRWYPKNLTVDAEFIIGSRFLELYSVEIDLVMGRFCISRNRE